MNIRTCSILRTGQTTTAGPEAAEQVRQGKEDDKRLSTRAGAADDSVSSGALSSMARESKALLHFRDMRHNPSRELYSVLHELTFEGWKKAVKRGAAAQ